MNATDPWEQLGLWFPDLDEKVWNKLREFTDLLREWNQKVNLVSRKDMERFETKHLAHCLVATKILKLMPKASLLDVGTGGGLPGIPLAICYPQANFTLLDSIGKKVTVLRDLTHRLELRNAKVIRGRVEEMPSKKSFDFVLGRAVTALPTFIQWTRKRIHKGRRHAPANGILYWKGGDYTAELEGTPWQPTQVWDCAELLPECGFEEKYLFHLKA
ncbi:MAG: 16S rRNA (guanine(527)-N(7))-methyltransferase RsmG [Opitutae bacterium]|nr:16S rRNA (guanine(527)-N(7))-methyltransferase RsmG [Opitutae bacterium]